MTAAPRPIRIVIADDHPVFREGLKRLLEAERDFEVVATARDGRETLRKVLDLRPDVLLLDLAMPDVAGLQALRGIERSGLAVRTIVLTAVIGPSETIEAVQLGARGIVLKEAATMLLCRCVRGVMAGESWVGHARVNEILEALRNQGRHGEPLPGRSLTRREQQIVAAIAEGASNKDIAEQIGVSEQTVKNQLSRIYDKLGVASRLELALYAVNKRLVEGNEPDA